MNDDEIDRAMQDLLPGSTRFKAKLQCACCGWKFDKGLTDPSGEHKQAIPNMVIICGECLTMNITDENCKLREVTSEDIQKMDAKTQADLGRAWRLHAAVKHGAHGTPAALREMILMRCKAEFAQMLDAIPQEWRNEFLARFDTDTPPPEVMKAMAGVGIKAEDVKQVIVELYRAKGWLQ